MKRTIGELLFDGYEDTVMEIGTSLDSEDDYFGEEEYGEEEEEGKVKLDKFGWFYKVAYNIELGCNPNVIYHLYRLTSSTFQ